MRGSWRRIGVVTLAAAASGVATAAVIAVINDIVSAEPRAQLWHYGVVAAFALVSGSWSQVLVNRLATDALLDLRLDLCQRIATVPLTTVDAIGAPSLLAVLTEDASAVAAAITFAPGVIISAATVVGAFVYLGISSPPAFGALAVVILFGVSTAWLLLRASEGLERKTRQQVGILYVRFRALIEGAKELRLDGKLRRAFLGGGIGAAAAGVRTHSLLSKTVTIGVVTWTRALLYCSLGVIISGQWGVTREVAAGFVLVLIFVMTPLEAIMSFLPIYGRAKIAILSMQQIGSTLSAATREEDIEWLGTPQSATIELSEVTYSYKSDDNRTFTVGPIDFTFDEGKIIFIVGGNGSGKSTLAKLITGLYVPKQGEVRVNDRRVVDTNREWYRQHFAAIFADFYLFDTVWGSLGSEVETLAKRYLEQLGLSEKVSFANATFSTTALSSGQRKRLALVSAFLSDRPVYVFDEWASDQDPTFKRIFYEKMVPDLKKRGKTVIVISHDDRYFNVADVLLKLEDGRITGDSTVAFMRRIRGSVPPPR